jgi:hypothetical protein
MKSVQAIAGVSMLLIGCSLATVATAQQSPSSVCTAGSSNAGEGRSLEEVIVFGNIEVSLYGKNLLSDYKVIQHVLINSLESAYTLKPVTVGIKAVVKLGAPRP